MTRRANIGPPAISKVRWIPTPRIAERLSPKLVATRVDGPATDSPFNEAFRLSDTPARRFLHRL